MFVVNVEGAVHRNLYVVRHCKAEGQAADARLTALGIQQAEKLADFLSDKAIDCIVSSPYERACRTILPLSDQLGIAIELDERLAERVLSEQNEPDWLDKLRQTYDDLDLCYSHIASAQTL